MNVGPAMLKDLQLLGIEKIEQLKDKTPDQLYEKLQQITGKKHDPCVWDFFLRLFMKLQQEKNYLGGIGAKKEKRAKLNASLLENLRYR